MTWETRVQAASFRGVPFFLESHATEGGRNTDSQEQEVIYGKVPPATNDLGARRDVYVLEALVIGPDYDLARNALLAELHAGGKGTLVHPYLGFLLVQVEDWTVEESTEEGGLARFSLTFSAARENPPFAVNEGGRLLAAMDAANKVAEANFLSKAQASVGGLAKGAAAFQAQVNGVVSQVVGGVQAFTEPLASLARTPANLAASVLGGVNAIVASIENARSAFTLLKQVIEHLQGRRTEGTSSANKAEQAMQSLFITAALGQMASQANQADWGNTQAARQAQTALLASLDAEIERADAQTYGPLRDMRASAIQAIAQASTGLPQVKSIILSAPMPWLALAQRLYPDAPDLSHQADAMWRRNLAVAPNPLFMPANTPLEYVEGA